MNRKYLAAMLISLLVSTTIGCQSKLVNEQQIEQFEKQIEVALKEGNTIDVNHITNFEWDKLYVFSPYTSIETIQDELGFKPYSLETHGIEYLDVFQLLVFVKDNKVILTHKFPRSYGDLVIKEQHLFLPTNAILEVRS